MIFKGSTNQHILEYRILQRISLENSPLLRIFSLDQSFSYLQYTGMSINIVHT